MVDVCEVVKMLTMARLVEWSPRGTVDQNRGAAVEPRRTPTYAVPCISVLSSSQDSMESPIMVLLFEHQCRLLEFSVNPEEDELFCM
jgi:hypothetical protein